MEPMAFAYNLLLNTLGFGALPVFWSKSKDNPAFRRGRLGCYAIDSPPPGHPSLWVHAASVGEVTGALPTLHALREQLPHAAVTLTVGTPQGFRFAVAQLGEAVQVLPFPLDFSWSLKRAFDTLRPDLYVALESEFWPNLFRLLHETHTPTILLNGRLSDRSVRWYRLAKPLFEPIFKQFRRLAMLAEEDRRNALSLGAPPERTLVMGSSKVDGLLLRARPEKAMYWRTLLDIPLQVPVVVGGSLRRAECIQLLEIFQALQQSEPQLVGIFAPRHLERVPEMASWLQQHQIPFQRLSALERTGERREAPVVLVDRIGVLFELYALGDLIFCGGTLEPIGGHNILEPAAWEKPVFYGPHLHKVYNEHNILQALEGGFSAQDAGDLLAQWSGWIKRLPDLQPHGERAQEALRQLGGVAAKHVELILSALEERG